MNILNDLKLVYSSAINRTINSIKNNPIVLLLPLVYGFIYEIAHYILVVVFKNGIIVSYGGYFISVMLLSSFLSLMRDLVIYNKISFKYFGRTFTKLIGTIIGVSFVLWVLDFLLVPIARGDISRKIYLLIFIVLNPLIEMIYMEGSIGLDCITSTLEFMRDNFIQWLIPLGIYLLITRTSTLYNFDPLYWVFGIRLSTSSILKYIVLQLIASIYISFRGSLFNILNGSTMRKRAYMGEIK